MLTSYLRADVDVGPPMFQQPGFTGDLRQVHRTFFEASLTGTWIVDDGLGTAVTAEPGSFFVVPAGTRSRQRLIADRHAEVVWGFIDLWEGGAFEVLGRFPRTWVLSGAASLEVRRLAVALRERPSTLGDRLDREARGLDLARLILDGAPAPHRAAGPIDPRVQVAADHVRRNLDRAVPRSELARLVHLSPSRLHDLFVSSLGVAPVRFVLDSRLRRACQLLVDTDEPVSRIARSCGFSDPGRFTRTFSSWIGASPSKYRGRFR